MPASQSSRQELLLYTQVFEKLEEIIRIKKNMKLSVGRIIGITVAYQVILAMFLFFIMLSAVVSYNWMSAQLQLESTVTLLSMTNEYIHFVWMAVVAGAMVPMIVYFIYPRIAESKIHSIYKEVEDIKLEISISNKASDSHAQ